MTRIDDIRRRAGYVIRPDTISPVDLIRTREDVTWLLERVAELTGVVRVMANEDCESYCGMICEDEDTDCCPQHARDVLARLEE